MTTITIPAIINAETQAALKNAAAKIALEIARADSLMGGFFADKAWESEGARDAMVAQINAIMNAAADLQGIQHRDWSAILIADAAADLSAKSAQ